MHPITKAAILAIALTYALPALADPTPKIPPFKLPTYKDSIQDFRAPIAPLRKLPEINMDALFLNILNCYPETSKFDKWSVKLEAGARLQDRLEFDEGGIGSHYIGIVASLPLFDAADMARERHWELERRKGVAKLVTAFRKALADREKAIRSLGLYMPLEKRSQVRVGSGIVGVDEQVRYLEKVIEWQEKKEVAEANITEARLSLVGQCRTNVRAIVNGFLVDLVHRGRARVTSVNHMRKRSLKMGELK